MKMLISHNEFLYVCAEEVIQNENFITFFEEIFALHIAKHSYHIR